MLKPSLKLLLVEHLAQVSSVFVATSAKQLRILLRNSGFAIYPEETAHSVSVPRLRFISWSRSALPHREGKQAAARAGELSRPESSPGT